MAEMYKIMDKLMAGKFAGHVEKLIFAPNGAEDLLYYAVFEDMGELISPVVFEVRKGHLKQVSRYVKNFFRNEEVWEHQHMECVDVPSSSKRGWDRYFSRTIMGEDYGPTETGRIISILDTCVTVEHTVTTQVKSIDGNTDVVYYLDGQVILHENMPVYEHWDPNAQPGSPDDYPWMADDTHKFEIGYQLMEQYPYAIHVLASSCDEFATYGSLERKLEEISNNLGDTKGADF